MADDEVVDDEALNPDNHGPDCPVRIWEDAECTCGGVKAAADVAAVDDESRIRPWSEFRNAGLLWLINTVVFHPRGYAIGIGVNPDDGWMLLGDGRERWSYDTADPDFVAELDDAFVRAQATLAPR